MDTQYKFRWILRDDDGVIEKALIAFYEGIYIGATNTFMIISRLDRSKLAHLKSQRFTRGGTGIESDVLYTKDDFGVISTDDELRTFLNGEMAKDTTRTTIPEQEIN